MKKVLFIFILNTLALLTAAQKNPRSVTDNWDSIFFTKTKFRLVGPFRGGRSCTVAGDYKDKNTFYFGATGGGGWKNEDGGSKWKNISDKTFGQMFYQIYFSN